MSSKQCKECGSWAINHNAHGRDGSDGDLCDVCYWRKRANKNMGDTYIGEIRENDNRLRWANGSLKWATDFIYLNLVRSVQIWGDTVITRNGQTKSRCDLDAITFVETPLVTVRKTAWKTALLEMEWFLSGDPKCPDELLKWWSGQLSPEGEYAWGYSTQFRHFGGAFDQIAYIKGELKSDPYSRRLCMTTWNPEDMANVARINDNPNTPA